MRVLQIIDSLHSGGAERVAVNIANSLVNSIDQSFLCSTREEGVLRSSLNSHVKYLFLEKRSILDFKAIYKLNKFIKNEKIDIIHAHSTSYFLATIIKLLNRNLKVVWHDHYGNSEFLNKRKSLVLKYCSKYFNFVLCVNNKLEKWSRSYLRIDDVLYLPNFAVVNEVKPQTTLLGKEGKRIICLANLRPQKDHFTLVSAFKNVVKEYPKWSLHLVGKDFNDDYSLKIKNLIESLDLKKNIFLYGSKPDISNILKQCEIGLLSSKSEGLPLAILEYGLARLPVIATKVGECESVITNSDFGILVKPQNEHDLFKAIVYFIDHVDERLQKSKALNLKIKEEFSQQVIVKYIITIYKKII